MTMDPTGPILLVQNGLPILALQFEKSWLVGRGTIIAAQRIGEFFNTTRLDENSKIEEVLEALFYFSCNSSIRGSERIFLLNYLSSKNIPIPDYIIALVTRDNRPDIESSPRVSILVSPEIVNQLKEDGTAISFDIAKREFYLPRNMINHHTASEVSAAMKKLGSSFSLGETLEKVDFNLVEGDEALPLTLENIDELARCILDGKRVIEDALKGYNWILRA